VLLKTYGEYYYGYTDEEGKHVDGYKDLIERLLQEFPIGEPIIGEERSKEFIKLFGSILRLQNILTAFDQFQGNEVISPRNMQDYQSNYLDIYRNIRVREAKSDVTADIVFEIELIKQVEVNIDYILMLVKRYHDDNCKDKEILVDIEKAIGSSTQLRSKRELIMQFISRVDPSADVDADWARFVSRQKDEDLRKLIEEYNLKPEETSQYVNNAFRDGDLRTTGTDIDKIMPPIRRFGGGDRLQQKNAVIERLKTFFDKYFGLI
jgi:type I restriction enzyme R subunit